MMHNTKKSAAIYTPFILKIYDWWVLGISNKYAWQCPTHAVLLPFFRRHIGMRHMDVGVGTGFYLAHSQVDPFTEITLLDLNRNSLDATQKRISHMAVKCIRHDVMNLLPFPEQIRFDSISIFYLLHCLPGKFGEKESVIANLKNHLTPDGILYGATILGETANHNWLGKRLMKIYNQKGVFGNNLDTIGELKEVLEHHFRSVEIRQCGKVALFTARDVLPTSSQD